MKVLWSEAAGSRGLNRESYRNVGSVNCLMMSVDAVSSFLSFFQRDLLSARHLWLRVLNNLPGVGCNYSCSWLFIESRPYNYTNSHTLLCWACGKHVRIFCAVWRREIQRDLKRLWWLLCCSCPWSQMHTSCFGCFFSFWCKTAAILYRKMGKTVKNNRS